MIKDGNASYYDAAQAKFISTPFGKTLVDPANGTLEDTKPFTPFNYGDAATFAKKVDNSVAGEMRDCGECHVGGGMMEYIIDPGKTAAAGVESVYDPTTRTSLREYVFGATVTAYNTLIDIYNPTKVDGKYSNRGNVITHDYAQTGVLEMDCLICHQSGYDWSKRKAAVREGQFDASRAMGANLATSAKDGVTVFYNSTSVTYSGGVYTVDLSAKLNAKPASAQCNSCHQGTAENKYQVEWKKRGEMWSYLDENGNKVDGDVHASIGCMACHERKDKSEANIGTNGLPGLAKATETEPAVKLSLCDPAKGGASPFEAMWNSLDDKQFKNCIGCHEPASVAGKTEDPLTYSGDSPYLTYETYGAPESRAAHTRLGLNSKIAYKADGVTRVSHIDLIDCTACHIRKEGFTGGAFVDGTGADHEGRLAVHDTENVARDMTDAAGLNWLGGKLHSSAFLTSFFWRDMNALKTGNGGLDINLDGREAGMDPVLPTHVNNINIANGLHALTDAGTITAATISAQQAKLIAGLPAQLGLAPEVDIRMMVDGAANPDVTNAFIPKISFLLVPFKTAHNIAGADKAWGVKGCKECHSEKGAVIAADDPDNRTGEAYAGGGFYNGTYPINGNMEGKFSFNSNQVATYTKVNGLVDTTDSHPNVVTKKGDRSVPIKVLSMFDNAYSQTVTPNQTLLNIDRSEVLYEATFQARNEDWIGSGTTPDSITGGIIPAACSGPTSPFYCETEGPIINAKAKRGATSTLGWTLKVEVKDDATGVITTRTKQISDDKIVDVNGIFSNLGAGFTDNADFTVHAILAATGTTGAGNNTLKLTPKAGKKIRLSNKSDVGPFGLKGKLWKAAPIVRDGVEYAGRAAWLGYLNNITNESAVSTVTLPTSGFSVTVPGNSAVASEGLTTLIDTLRKDEGVTLGGVQAGMTYEWRVNTAYDTDALHGEDEVPPRVVNARISDPTSSNPVITFNKTGIWRITLAVTNRDGKVSVQTQRVYVSVPNLIGTAGVVSTSYTGLGTLAGVTTTRTTITTNVTAVLDAGKTFDKAKIVWGDGSAAKIITKALNNTQIGAQAHIYNLAVKYKTAVPTVYKYTTTVQFWSGTTLIATKSFPVEIDTAPGAYATGDNPYPVVP